MQYKSITYQRVIVPKAYESKRLEVTVELDENDDLEIVSSELIQQVKDLIQTHYDAVDGEHIFADSQALTKAALARQNAQLVENLDDIKF